MSSSGGFAPGGSGRAGGGFPGGIGRPGGAPLGGIGPSSSSPGGGSLPGGIPGGGALAWSCAPGRWGPTWGRTRRWSPTWSRARRRCSSRLLRRGSSSSLLWWRCPASLLWWRCPASLLRWRPSIAWPARLPRRWSTPLPRCWRSGPRWWSAALRSLTRSWRPCTWWRSTPLGPAGGGWTWGWSTLGRSRPGGGGLAPGGGPFPRSTHLVAVDGAGPRQFGGGLPTWWRSLLPARGGLPPGGGRCCPLGGGLPPGGGRCCPLGGGLPPGGGRCCPLGEASHLVEVAGPLGEVVAH